MMKDICFYLMTQKGYQVLRDFVDHFGKHPIRFVQAARDRQVEKDYFAEISALCQEHGVTCYERTKAPAEETDENTLKIAIGWRWLIRDTQNLVVLHDSLLPRYRGFAPLVNALINGEEQVGVTALWASQEYDRGDILMQKALPVTYPARIERVIAEVSALYSAVVIELFEQAGSGVPLRAASQAEDAATYSLWRDDEDYFIDWHLDSALVRRMVDALGFPYLGARTRIGAQEVVILDVDPVEDVQVENRQMAVGKVIFVQEGCPVVVCGKGLLRINTLKSYPDGEDLLPLKKMRIRFR
jgi:methionyl-tRNA formyltransferase